MLSKYEPIQRLILPYLMIIEKILNTLPSNSFFFGRIQVPENWILSNQTATNIHTCKYQVRVFSSPLIFKSSLSLKSLQVHNFGNITFMSYAFFKINRFDVFKCKSIFGETISNLNLHLQSCIQKYVLQSFIYSTFKVFDLLYFLYITQNLGALTREIFVLKCFKLLKNMPMANFFFKINNLSQKKFAITFFITHTIGICFHFEKARPFLV